jgi:hypothetical protein
MAEMLRAGLLALFASGCGRVGFQSVGDAPAAVPDVDAIACTQPQILHPADEGLMHQDAGPIDYVANPPTSGTHYPAWGHWDRTYAEALPRGYWVHNLEHGAVVFLWSCPDGCADDVARLTAMMAALPTDEACTEPPIYHRALVTEDPLMPPGVRFAASAWDVAMTANCLDEAAMAQFFADNHGHAPETRCDDGTFP